VMLTGRGDLTYGVRLPNRVVDALCVAMRELPGCTPPELQPGKWNDETQPAKDAAIEQLNVAFGFWMRSEFTRLQKRVIAFGMTQSESVLRMLPVALVVRIFDFVRASEEPKLQLRYAGFSGTEDEVRVPHWYILCGKDDSPSWDFSNDARRDSIHLMGLPRPMVSHTVEFCAPLGELTPPPGVKGKLEASLPLICAVDGACPPTPEPFSGYELLIGWNLLGDMCAQ